MSTKYGHTKMFQNEQQEKLYEAIESSKTSDVATLVKIPAVKRILTVPEGDNTVQAKKIRLRGRIRVLRRRLASRGSSLPFSE